MNYLKCFSISDLANFSYAKILYTCFRIFLIAVFFIPCFVKPVPAMDFLIGVKGGYFVWDPYLTRVGSPQFDSMENGAGELYGPVFSVLFTSDLSLSVSGLYGQQSSHWTSEDFKHSSTDTMVETSTFIMEVERIDIDSALSYRLSENFKIFAGYKYQYFDMLMDNSGFQRDPSNAANLIGFHGESEVKMPFNGPAIGVGFSTPFGERFFFASNLSALYMWGKIKFSGDSYYYDTTDTTKKFPTGGNDSSGITLRSRGLNLEPTVGAGLGEGSPIVTLGIRAQWSQIKFVNGDKMGLKEKWANDYQYGLFVSIVQPF